MTGPIQEDDSGLQLRRLTVANIREVDTANFVEIVFLESTRFYRLPKKNENFIESIRILKKALAGNTPIMVAFTTPNSDEISNVNY